jgi:hypothetical protein
VRGAQKHPLTKKKMTLDAFLACQHLLVSPEGDGVGHVDTVLAQLGRKRDIAVTLPQMYAAPAIIANSDLLATMMEGAVQAAACATSLRCCRCRRNRIGASALRAALASPQRCPSGPALAAGADRAGVPP